MGLLKQTLVFVWDVFESIVFALAIFVVSYLFFFAPGEVHGSSSYPTWQEDERFITDKISYKFNPPERGDFVVLESPKNTDVDFIKRIVGLPEETIKISRCQVLINDVVLNENYLPSGTCTLGQSFLKENFDYIIPPDHYFVLGDNRSGSSDSRGFGPIPRSSIIGKVIFRYWPPERIEIIPN